MKEAYMNKAELIEALKDGNGLTKAEAAKIVNLFFDEISSALEKDYRVEIRGFCSFYIKNYKAYTGRNPKTGTTVSVHPKKLPFFKCGKELKERVDTE